MYQNYKYLTSSQSVHRQLSTLHAFRCIVFFKNNFAVKGYGMSDKAARMK